MLGPIQKTEPDYVETYIMEPVPDKPGYSRLARQKTVREVYEELRAILGHYPDGAEEYFSIGMYHTLDRETRGKHLSDDERYEVYKRIHGGDTPWPEGRIHISVVTGGSEGHYTHVDVHTPDGEIADVFLCKTFMGWDAAWSFAKRLGEILQV